MNLVHFDVTFYINTWVCIPCLNIHCYCQSKLGIDFHCRKIVNFIYSGYYVPIAYVGQGRY